MPKEISQFICLSVILIDCFLEHGNIITLKYFWNVKMLLKKKRCLSITDDLEISSDYDEENSNEEN